MDTLNGIIPEGSISFTILREPKERFISCIRYFLSRLEQNKEYNQEQMIDICLSHNFSNAELADALKQGSMGINIDRMLAIHSVSIFHPFLNVFDDEKKLKADHLIDFKDIVGGLKKILPDHNLDNFPHTNVSSPGIVVELSSEQSELFNERFADDIKFYKETGFGYEA